MHLSEQVFMLLVFTIL